jgi:ribose transport system substrate-binding protein
MIAAAVAAAPAIAACSSSSSSSSPASAAAGAGGGTSGVPAAVESLLQSGYKGTFQPPPSSGPKAAAGKSVWVLSCGQVSGTCAEIADDAMAAGKALGWKMTLFDGKLDPTLFSQGIQQAIAANANGILTVAVDCSLARSALLQAKSAGVATVTVSGFDCDDPLQNTGTPVYSTYVKYTGIPTYGESFEDWKKYDAAWLTAQTGGTAKVINTYAPGYLVSLHQNKGFDAEMALCPACSIVSNLGITATDQEGTGAQQKLQTALTQDSTASALQVGVGSWFGRFANAAIRSAARTGVFVSGDECEAADIAAIKAGGPEQMCVARDWGWEAWAGMDELNRQFAAPGSAPVDEGLGFEVVDKTHNLPSGATWSAPFNYQAAYEKIWQG